MWFWVYKALSAGTVISLALASAPLRDSHTETVVRGLVHCSRESAALVLNGEWGGCAFVYMSLSACGFP